MTSKRLLFLLTFAHIGEAALLPKWDIAITTYNSKVVSVRNLLTVAIQVVQVLLISYLCYRELWPLIVRNWRKLFKILWLIVERYFQANVFLLQFVLAATIILRIILLRNPEWDTVITVSSGLIIKRSEVAIAIVWILICVFSTISIIHMGWVMYNDPPRQVPRRLFLLKLLWIVPMLLGTLSYFIAVNWYVYKACTSTLDTKFQYFQVAPALFLLLHGFMQIIFIRQRGYNFNTFIGFSNVSFNLVMMIHLCTCCVDGIGTKIHSPDLVLPTALVVTSPFELAHRTVALLVFMPNILAFNVFQQMFGPRRNILSPATLETQIMERNLNIFVLNHELVSHNTRLQKSDFILPKIDTLGWSIDDCLILHTQSCPSCDTVVNAPMNILLSVDNMVLKRTKIEQENPQVIAPSIYEMSPKQAQHDPIWGGVSYVGGAPIVPNDCCDGITPGATVQGCYSECAVDVSGQGGGSGIQDAFCVGSFG